MLATIWSTSGELDTIFTDLFTKLFIIIGVGQGNKLLSVVANASYARGGGIYVEGTMYELGRTPPWLNPPC